MYRKADAPAWTRGARLPTEQRSVSTSGWRRDYRQPRVCWRCQQQQRRQRQQQQHRGGRHDASAAENQLRCSGRKAASLRCPDGIECEHWQRREWRCCFFIDRIFAAKCPANAILRFCKRPQETRLRNAAHTGRTAAATAAA